VLHTEARDFENWANPDYYFTYDNPEVKLYQQSLSATDDADIRRPAEAGREDRRRRPGRRLAVQRRIRRRRRHRPSGSRRSTSTSA
jgi:hypothetical protein